MLILITFLGWCQVCVYSKLLYLYLFVYLSVFTENHESTLISPIPNEYHRPYVSFLPPWTVRNLAPNILLRGFIYCSLSHQPPPPPWTPLHLTCVHTSCSKPAPHPLLGWTPSSPCPDCRGQGLSLCPAAHPHRTFPHPFRR